MSVAIQRPMTIEEFLAWEEGQELRWEFDGFAPVAMTGGTANHNRISHNLYSALRARLRGCGCEPFGLDAGVATIGDAVRYPDALVSCTKTPGTAHVVEGVVVVFEVLSPTSGRTDRIVKLREYRAVPTIRRYVILEYTGIGLSVFERASGDEPWRATALTADDTLRMPEIGIDIPVAELYQEVDLPEAGTGEADNSAAAR